MKIILIIWIICGILTYGIHFGYFQRKYPELAEKNYKKDMGDAILFGLTGPIGLCVSFLESGMAEHGLKFK